MKKIAEVQDLRLKFAGEESLLFKDLSLSFFQGEKVLLLGPSGCGKSTLLQVLAGIIPHSIDIPMKAKQLMLPKSWGYVFQDPDTQFCMPYVDEEIAFVLENLQVPQSEMKDLIINHLNEVGLTLDDFHTEIHTLSGGMKQRLALASVMALQPELLILDEPTAMLDPNGTKQVWDTIKKVGKEKTVLIVEHKIDEVIDFVDRIIIFNHNGEILADGKKEDIFPSYKPLLEEQGIWYPGVWDDYMKKKERLNQVQSTEYKDVVITLKDFTGLRGKQEKIKVGNNSVTEGEWITIVGENGAGKSTLLHALMQLIKTNGDYFLHGKQIQQFSHLDGKMTFVFQNPEFQFVTNSTYDEIAYSLRLDDVSEYEVNQKTIELLNIFQLEKQKETHPYQLSMGQKRRLSVASAIVKDPNILLLDEPTFGQDAQNTFAILEQMEAWRKLGKTIIMVTHDMHIVEHFANRVWHIESGILTGDYESNDFLSHVVKQRQTAF